MTRSHDLPPRWDGLPVEWDEWWTLPDQQPTMCRIHEDGDSQPAFGHDLCTGCGRTSRHPIRHGRARTDIGGPLHLVADRCPHCGHDTVSAISRGKWCTWDLDINDYLESGSYERTPR